MTIWEVMSAGRDLGKPQISDQGWWDHGNLSGACQKVIECLYIILPSYNMYLITFWHNSALAFILGWWPYERVMSASLRSSARSNLGAGWDHGNLSGAGACQKVIECLYIILPSYNMYLITFWHNSALAFILGWWPYERSCRPAEISASHKSRPAEIMATYQVQCMPEGHWVLIYHPAIL